MLAPELIEELRVIAFCPAAKPVNRVAACNSLYRDGTDVDRVRATLYELATDASTPDAVKVRAIDLLAKIDLSKAPKELADNEIADLEQSLMRQYVGETQSDSRTI